MVAHTPERVIMKLINNDRLYRTKNVRDEFGKRREIPVYVFVFRVVNMDGNGRLT